MNSPSLSSIASLPPELSVPVSSAARDVKAAREFEAQLIASVLQSLERTFGGLPGEDSIAGADNYNYLGTQAFSQALAEKGGFGIASLILEHLPLHEGER
jgi:Rod binding domain-containing protein